MSTQIRTPDEPSRYHVPGYVRATGVDAELTQLRAAARLLADALSCLLDALEAHPEDGPGDSELRRQQGIRRAKEMLGPLA